MEVTVNQAMRITGYGRRHIYRLIAEGTIMSRQLKNREYMIDKGSLLSYTSNIRKGRPAKKKQNR